MNRGHWVVQMNHRNRTLAFMLCFLCLVLHMRPDSGYIGVWAALVVQFLLMPHVLYLRAKNASDPLKAETDHVMFDALVFGFWSGLLAFPIWIAFIFLIGSLVNPAAFRGYPGLLTGAMAYALGAVPGWAMAGFDFLPDTSLEVTLLAVVSVTVFLVTVALGAYRRSVTLFDTKQALREKEYVLKQQLQEITLLQQQLEEQAIRDPLTGLYNRRHFEAMLERAIAAHERSHVAVALVMIDLDHFKLVNDRHGHPAGDDVLRAVSDLLRRNVRATDVVARLGGEEFVILLEGGRTQDAVERAERIRVAWQDNTVHTEGKRISSTLSAGVAHLRSDETVSQLIRRADVALYQAKNGGRNRVVTAA